MDRCSFSYPMMPNVNSSSLINDHRHLPAQFVTHVLLTIIKILCVYKTIKFRKFEVIVERTVQWSSSPFRHSDSLWTLPGSHTALVTTTVGPPNRSRYSKENGERFFFTWHGLDLINECPTNVTTSSSPSPTINVG